MKHMTITGDVQPKRGSLDDAKDERRQRDDHEQLAHRIQPSGMLRARFGNEALGHDERHQTDGNVDDEDPAPSKAGADERAPDDGAERKREPRDARPDAERATRVRQNR